MDLTPGGSDNSRYSVERSRAGLGEFYWGKEGLTPGDRVGRQVGAYNCGDYWALGECCCWDLGMTVDG